MADAGATGPDPIPTPAPPPRARKRRWLRPLLLALGPIAVLAGITYAYATDRGVVGIDNAYVRADIATVSSEVAGRVTRILVGEHEAVKAGQLLVEIDDEPYRIAVEQAQAKLATVRNQVAAAKATFAQRQQEVRSARSDLAFYQRELQRKQDLLARGVIARATFDQAEHDSTKARADAAAADQQAAVISSVLDGDAGKAVDDYAMVQDALAGLHAAERNLRNTRIVAPIDGITANVTAVQPGQVVSASRALFSIVHESDMWVEASPKETELTWVKAGDPVTITIDAYPGATWHGHVDTLSPASDAQFSVLPAQNSSGNWVKVVQRIPLRVAIDPATDNPPLRAGMSAVVAIDTGHPADLPLGLSHVIGTAKASASH
ncbi:HlyD family secretion protein [Zavarzinia sp. CC-PAN008]|uniref:HlyD family secretion protein n=1 Tax=Zavarzinia sp. CC-PAN008 TaxID=3243332 RepID=UPI003F74223C